MEDKMKYKNDSQPILIKGNTVVTVKQRTDGKTTKYKQEEVKCKCNHSIQLH